MRIGEFYQVLQQATNDDGTLQTNGEVIYEGQAYRIRDFRPKAKLVELLNELNLLPDVVDSTALALISAHAGQDEFQLDTTEHNQIVGVFNIVNPNLPTIAKAVEAFAPSEEHHSSR